MTSTTAKVRLSCPCGTAVEFEGPLEDAQSFTAKFQLTHKAHMEQPKSWRPRPTPWLSAARTRTEPLMSDAREMFEELTVEVADMLDDLSRRVRPKGKE